MPETAATKLTQLVSEFADKLKLLGREPLAIASARNKFNDAHQDDYWCAVQLEQYRWEQSQFFGAEDGHGSAQESSNRKLEADAYGSANSQPPDLGAARTLLRQLDKAGWHELADQAFGLPTHGGIIALVVQFDQVWLHCSHPQGSEGEQILALVNGETKLLTYTDDRFDELIGHPELIRCPEADPEIIQMLSPRSQFQFGNRIRDTGAAHQLVTRLVCLGEQIDDLISYRGRPTPRFAFRLGVGFRDERYRGYKTVGSAFLLARFAIDSCYYDRNYFNILSHSNNPDAKVRLDELNAGPFHDLWEILKDVDEAGLRRLFEAATGANTFDDDDLFWLLVDRVPYLRFRDKLYQIDQGGLSYLGDWRRLEEPLGPASNKWLDEMRRVFATPSQRIM